ncbi:VOC family protein [Pseudonocardia benzenivorans]|jgi:catechol 2,3-dioxygenase-like lactoylglutathione lyase family enzyme|uniref:Glyoxalase/bleomycin resistance protein/dioxygenase n=2 Tax=Pseudonocardia TaxID=1847 RepID=F4D1V0_PSEUX|nr:VOC family protein [Pseudonocardia dioxanivorans]AEA28010.1 Glyoxalase/bleomycin resistance protein/dioxygenase [Pseudonocardia dioxanivorans CB1190]GJF06298.1 glyoxalase [Pseudonocardia sp. D17]
MFRGLSTVSFYTDDLAAARAWYTELLGVEPYFAFPPAPQPPAYIEFRIGDDEDELGFVDRRWAPAGASAAPGGAVVFWHVDDLEAAVARLLELGATEYEPVTPRGSGFVTASVVDPFGNVLGVMTNPHFAALHEA